MTTAYLLLAVQALMGVLNVLLALALIPHPSTTGPTRHVLRRTPSERKHRR